jgi:hypothetical protein
MLLCDNIASVTSLQKYETQRETIPEDNMIKLHKAVIAALVVSGTIGGAQATTIKQLQGAWAMKGSKCDEIFKKVGKKVEFKDRIAPISTGLLFTGNKVAGPMAVCTIKQVREKSSRLSAQLSCETSMVVEELTVGFDVPNPSELRRFDLFGEYATYQKCNM